MKEQVKLITTAVERGADHETAMWFVKLDAGLSVRWSNGAYWRGWIEAEVARALGLDWLDTQRAGYRFNLCRMTETLFAATLTRQIEGS